MRILVTGASGFIGGFLVEALTARGDVVAPWTRGDLDVTDGASVADALQRFTPDVVVHLAAQSLPGRSWENPAETYRINVGGTINLLEAARREATPPRILLAGSSAEYAEPIDQVPIAEDGRIAPNSPYGSSKFAASQLGEMYFERYNLPVLRFRPFYLIGPRKRGDVCSDFARRIVAIERGGEPKMRVGDLSVIRDMMDVRDGVGALLRLIDDGVPGEIYNICSGHGVRLAQLLETFGGLAAVPLEIERDPALLRPLEQRVKIGDPAKLRALGWQPTHELADTLANILMYWRAADGGNSGF